MAKRYVPPVQKGFGQFVDSIFLLVLVYLSLLAPLVLNVSDAPAPVEAGKRAVSWEQLKQNPTMQSQWHKLGYDAEKAEPIVTKHFNYEIEPISLITTIVVIAGYFLFVLRVSEREYRQVIAEKFDGTTSRKEG